MSEIKLATFGAGCFWGVEKAFKKRYQNLITTAVGYSGGATSNPTYKDVCSGQTGYAEVIQIKYSPSSVEYADLVDFFYRMHEPFTLNRQGNDHGTQYRSVIFYHDDSQKKTADDITHKAQQVYANQKITTTLEKFERFYPAEEYHQDYLTKNPYGYECATHFERSWEKLKSLFSK